MIAYVSSFIDRQIIALMVTPIRRDLGHQRHPDEPPHGVVVRGLLQCPRPPDRLACGPDERRTIIAWAIATWSAMTAFCGLARNYWQLFLARVGVGVGEVTSRCRRA
ncbi:MAG: hypothetical protein R2882_06700 [Gemmatimonadales bacterium]